MFLGRYQLRGEMPGQELVNTVDGMIGYMGKHMAQPGAEVGYENTSHFIRASKLRFGVTPGQARAQADLP